MSIGGDVVGFEYDYVKTLKSPENFLDKAQKILKPTNRDLKIYGEFTLPQKERDQTSAAAVLSLIIKKKTDPIDKAVRAGLKLACGTWWKDNVVAGSSPPVFQPGKSPKSLSELSAALTAILVDAQAQMTKEVQTVLRKNVKGKIRKKTTKIQAVKHATLPALSMAGATLAVILTIGTLGIAIPLAVISLHKAAKDVTAALRFIKGDYRKTETLEKNIVALAKKLQGELDDLEGARKQLTKSWGGADPDTIKDVKKKKAAIQEREVKSALFSKLLSVRTDSISTLELMLKKYKKKINEHYYHAYSTGKKIDKFFDKSKHAKAKMIVLQKEIVSLSSDTKEKDWKPLVAKITFLQSNIQEIDKSAVLLEGLVEDIAALALGSSGTNSAVFSAQPQWVQQGFASTVLCDATAVSLSTATEIANKAGEYGAAAKDFGKDKWNKVFSS